MWNRNIRVVIIPIIMAFAFLGLSRHYLQVGSLIDYNLSPLAMWVVAGIAGNFIAPDGMIDSAAWGTHVTTTCIVVSMTLNALVTGLIVFKIFKVFQVSSTILDETSLGVPGGSTLRYVMFVIIESGMILFSIQLARVVTTALKAGGSKSDLEAFNLFVSSHEMLNVIKTASSSIVNFFLLINFWLGYNTYHHPSAGIDGIIFPRRDIFNRSCR